MVIRVRRVGVVRNSEWEPEDEEAVEPVTEEEGSMVEVVEPMLEEEGVVERAGEVTEVAATELPAKMTTGEVPGSEVLATKVSTEASDVAASETATSDVPTAEAAAVTHADRERNAAGQGKRQDEGETGEVSTGDGQRPMNRRELHGRSLVAL